MSIELYPHNQRTYKKMTEMFEQGDRVGAVQPTGTGKSFLILKWIEDHPNDKFIVLSPSVQIFTQFLEYAEKTNDLQMLDSVKMISYQTLLRMTDEEIQALRADKIVIDEFHRTGALQWGPALLKLLEANPDAKVFGTSATPVRYLDELRDMASELFDRNLAVEMTLGDAVGEKILPLPKLVCAWYDIDGKMIQYEHDIAAVSDLKERKELKERLKQMKRRLHDAYGVKDVFEKNMPHDHGKFIVFCRDREHLEEMKAVMPQWLSRVNKKIHSYVSLSALNDKDLQIEAFKNDDSEQAIKLLFTIDRLNEGLHVFVDGVVMLRPTISPIIYLQQMGRALASGNESPIIFDLVNNFYNVRVPVKTGETLNVFERELRGAVEYNDWPEAFQIFEEALSFSSFFEELEDVLYPDRDEVWDKKYRLLEQFVEEYRRFPRRNDEYQGVKIGVWCDSQKTFAKKGALSSERLEKLDALGLFETSQSAIWHKNFHLLEQFVEEYERIPKSGEEYFGVNIGQWCIKQKALAKKGKLPFKLLEKLASLGLFKTFRSVVWEKKYRLLEQFVEEYGRFPKMNEEYFGVNLGNWCIKQKALAKKGKLPFEQFEKLKSIGLFETLSTLRWEKHYFLLEQFVKEFGRLPKSKEEYHDVDIGLWFTGQKKFAKKGILSPERREKLEAIGSFKPFQVDTWEKKYRLLEQFVEEYRRLPKRNEEYFGVNLGNWCTHQKAMHKSGKLPTERKEKLIRIGLLSQDKPSLDSVIANATAENSEVRSAFKAGIEER